MTRRPTVHSADLAFIADTGVGGVQYEHASFLGFRFKDPVEILDETVMHGLDVAGTPRTECISQMLASRLHDVSASRTREIGLHLFRHAGRNAPGSVATEIDEVSLALLGSMRVSPAHILLLSAMFNGERTEIRVGCADHEPSDLSFAQTREDEEQILHLSTIIGDGVAWNGEGIRTARRLPETVLATAPGRPLREVVSHPVLDLFDMTIREVRPDGMLDVGHVPYRPIDWSSGFAPQRR